MSQPQSTEGGVQCRAAKRMVAVVLTLVIGKITLADATRPHRLAVAEIEQWKEDFLT